MEDLAKEREERWEKLERDFQIVLAMLSNRNQNGE
jgi:hypothetical protein